MLLFKNAGGNAVYDASGTKALLAALDSFGNSKEKELQLDILRAKKDNIDKQNMLADKEFKFKVDKWNADRADRLEKKNNEKIALNGLIDSLSSPVSTPSMVETKTVDVPKIVKSYNSDAINNKLADLEKLGKLNYQEESVRDPLTDKQIEIVEAFKAANTLTDPVEKKRALLSLNKIYENELGLKGAPETDWDAYMNDVKNLDAPGTMATAGAITGAAIGAPLLGIGAIPGAAIGATLGYGSQKIDELKDWWDEPGIFSSEQEKLKWQEKHKGDVLKNKIQNKTGYERAQIKVAELMNKYKNNQQQLSSSRKHNQKINDIVNSVLESNKEDKKITEKKKVKALMSPSDFKSKVDSLFAPKIAALKGKSSSYVLPILKQINSDKKDMLTRFQKEYDKQLLKNEKNNDRIQKNKDTAAHEILKSKLANEKEILKQTLKQNAPKTAEDKLKLKKLKLSIKKIEEQIKKLKFKNES
jgi:hypothetical protein